tara:strand:- start:1409 stop:3178 length:1770 start_codon:yes stop_codon:yes gene_type:complete
LTTKKNLKIHKLSFALWKKLSQKRKVQLLCLTLLMIINAFAEVCTIASIIPFLSVISNPDILWQNDLFRNIALNFGFKNVDQTFLPLTIIFCFLILFSSIIRIFNLKMNLELAALIGTDLSCEAYEKILYQPFSFHIKTNSSDVISTIIAETKETTWSINNFLQIFTSVIIFLGIFISGMIFNWKIIFLLVTFIGISYLIVFLINRKQLSRNSKILAEKTRLQLKSLQEGLGSIKDILINNNQKLFLQEYFSVDKKLRISQVRGLYIGEYPKYILESIGILLLAIIAFYIASGNQYNTAAIPTLGTIALGSQRLLPICQTIYRSWAAIENNSVAIYKVLKMIKKNKPSIYSKKKNMRFKFNKIIKINHLYFSFNNDEKYILKDISFEIKKGEKIALIGDTGSGKSTLINILMGLLNPTKGSIEVDGFKVFDNEKINNLIEWRSLISHVPQSIFLIDDTIEKNVALGTKDNEIDKKRVKECLKNAQLINFIDFSSSKNVGERGIQLSGGQSQRVGLARALYKEAEVLFLDEATSALDNQTEKSLMYSINNLKRITIVLIAHRLSTIANCDKVIKLKNGEIEKIGIPKDFL